MVPVETSNPKLHTSEFVLLREFGTVLHIIEEMVEKEDCTRYN
jgi:hypothetical protein